MAAPDAVDLFTYGLHELQGFTNQMVIALAQYKSTGTLPESQYAGLPGPSDLQHGTAKPAAKQTAKQVKAAKAAAAEANGAPAAKPRALTAFNWFVKAQIEDLKKEGVAGQTKGEDGKTTNLMTMASARWKALGTEGQAAFTANFKVYCKNNVTVYDSCAYT